MKLKIKRAFAVILSVLTLACAFAGTALAADATSSTTATGGTSYIYIIYFAVIIAVFYFLVIRPEKKKRKQADELRKSLQVGDTITTIGGMVGKIVEMNDNFLTFETGEDRVRIQVAKWAISTTGKAATEEQK